MDERGESCKTVYGNFAENFDIYIQDFFQTWKQNNKQIPKFIIKIVIQLETK